MRDRKEIGPCLVWCPSICRRFRNRLHLPNWVIVIMVFGALYLKESVKGVRDEKHPFVWCLGASLSRLLPVIEINKEFTNFFNDPERKRLTGWQVLSFP
jgi:hypothetical protein